MDATLSERECFDDFESVLGEFRESGDTVTVLEASVV